MTPPPTNRVNVYAPSGNQNRNARRVLFNETLPRNLQLRTLQPILIGDFNCVLSANDCEQNFNQKKCESLAPRFRVVIHRDYSFDVAKHNKSRHFS